MAPRETILIVDDNDTVRSQLRWALKGDQDILEASDRDGAIALVRHNPVDLVLLDLRLPPYEAEIRAGREVLETIRETRPGLPVIIMTGDQDRGTAVEMVSAGAFDFFRKPIDLPELRVVVKRALRMHRLETEVDRLRSHVEADHAIENLEGSSPAMQELTGLVLKVADTSATILITGESGTGKELVARALHRLSARRRAPFVALNCAAIPSSLIDDELFGHEKGAFTGAVGRRIGKFEFAGGGTLFLDEVGDLPEPVQQRLLRVLQESEIQRLGGNESIPVDVRLVAATHQDLERRVAEGLFREDLYYRLKVVRIHVPPLRERAGDVRLLAEHFLSRQAGSGNLARRFSSEALVAMEQHDWPGNVREIENLVTSLAVTCEKTIIDVTDLPNEIRRAGSLRDSDAVSAVDPGGRSEDGSLDLPAAERSLIARALDRSAGNKTQAARLLGISRHVLLGKMKKHGLG